MALAILWITLKLLLPEKMKNIQICIQLCKGSREEGFDDIAKLFDLVAKIEAHHEERYKKLIDNINNSTVFKSEGKKLWICRNCGHIHYGESAPKVCPTCKHPRLTLKLWLKISNIYFWHFKRLCGKNHRAFFVPFSVTGSQTFPAQFSTCCRNRHSHSLNYFHSSRKEE